MLGKELTLPFHVVDGPTPFLLSNQWLAEFGAVVNFSTGKALFTKLGNRQIQLVKTQSGHWTLPLTMFSGNEDEYQNLFVKEPHRDVPVDTLSNMHDHLESKGE